MSDDSTTFTVYTCNKRDNLWVSTVLYNPHHSTHHSTLHPYNLYFIPSVLYPPPHSTIKQQFSTPPPPLHPTVHYTPLYTTPYCTLHSIVLHTLQYCAPHSNLHPTVLYPHSTLHPTVLNSLQQYSTPSHSTLPPPTVLYPYSTMQLRYFSPRQCSAPYSIIPS